MHDASVCAVITPQQKHTTQSDLQPSTVFIVPHHRAGLRVEQRRLAEQELGLEGDVSFSRKDRICLQTKRLHRT
jgi:hypothetical protein